MDADDPFPDAADHKISVSGGNDLGKGGCEDRKKGYWGKCKEGI